LHIRKIHTNGLSAEMTLQERRIAVFMWFSVRCKSIGHCISGIFLASSPSKPLLPLHHKPPASLRGRAEFTARVVGLAFRARTPAVVFVRRLVHSSQFAMDGHDLALQGSRPVMDIYGSSGGLPGLLLILAFLRERGYGCRQLSRSPIRYRVHSSSND
jgi:hypothetical protein